MKTPSSSLYYNMKLAVLICGLIAGILGGCSGCDEKTFDAPRLGPAAGNIPVGGGDTNRISLSVPSGTVMTVGNNTAEAVIIARVESELGQAVTDDTTVVWTTSCGSLDETATTTTQGSTSVTLTFPDNYVGCCTVTGIAGESSDWEQVCVDRRAESFILSAEDDDIDAYETMKLTAIIAGSEDPQAGRLVTFVITDGGEYATVNPSSAVTDSSGRASVNFEGQNNETDPQMVTVEATLDDGRTATITIRVRGTSETETGFILTAADTDFNDDASTVLTATVTENGEAEAGVLVTFEITTGEDLATLSASADTTDDSGQASVTLQGLGNNSDDDVVTIEATLPDGTTTSLTVMLRGTTETGFILTAGATDIDDDASTVLTATVTEGGVAEAGVLVTFEITTGDDLATLSASADTTDNSGQASVTLQGLDNNSGDDIVTIEATLPDGTTTTLTIFLRDV